MESLRVFFTACIVATCLRPGQAALTATVTVSQDGIPASETCHLPSVLPVTIRTPQETITLSLSQNTDILDTPMFFMRRSKTGPPIFIKDSISGAKATAMYQGNSNLAQFEVTCRMLGTNERRYILIGSLVLSDGKEYQLAKAAHMSPWLDYTNLYTLTEEGESPPGFNAGEYRDDNSGPLSVPRSSTASARAIANDVYIDVMALIENSVYLRWLMLSADGTDVERKQEATDNIRGYFARIFNAVNQRFKTASQRMHIRFAGFIIEDEGSNEWFDSIRRNEADQTKIESGALLDTMWDLRLSGDFPAHDHLVSFTNVDIYWIDPDGMFLDVVGLASVAQTCIANNSKSVSIVEYRAHFVADVRTTAHEIGHSLSSRHDGTGNDCVSADNYIMTGDPRTYDTTNNNPYVFSTCSADYFDNHVNTYLTGSLSSNFSESCLLESLPQVSVPDVTGQFHGQLYDVHEQCRLIYGPDARFCVGVDLTGITVCQQMSCFNPENGQCLLHYAARGTTCGNKMWCQEGLCVTSEDAPAANDDCLFGDRPGIVYTPLNQTCPEFIPTNLASRCDDPTTKTLCCETCIKRTCNKECLNRGFVNSTTCLCECPPGVSGDLCEISSCTKTCLNGGTLNADTCTCGCREFYTGTSCETNTCTKTCLSGGTLNADTCTCGCREFYTGTTCETNTCTKTCLNGGTLNADTCTCGCREFYTGTTCETNTSTCTKTCLNGGTLNADTCTCGCREFYTGSTCETNTCTKTCLSGGTLNADTCTCGCREFYTGSTCETNTCTKTCLSGGTLNADTCTCGCREFYTGSTCETNTCTKTCLSGGTLNADTCTCGCREFYTGTTCETNTCTKTCLSGGTLNADTCTCGCREFYTGTTCETNTCTKTCLSGGTLNADTCTCGCREFYTGTTCETNTCTKTCLNGGTLNADTCTCGCREFYTGTTCETNTCTKTCLNGGTLNRDTCTCTCREFYTGTTCETNTCTISCSNGGTPNIDTCSCSCTSSWTGSTCAQCSRECLNGGTQQPLTCSCACRDGYSGANCQTPLSGCSRTCENGGALNSTTCECSCVGNYIGNSCETCSTSCPADQRLYGPNCVCIPAEVDCDRTEGWFCGYVREARKCVGSFGFMVGCPQSCRTCEIQAPDPLTTKGYE